MTSAWRLLPTAHFKRDVSGVRSKDPETIQRLESAMRILIRDPYNLSRRHHIKKLRDVPFGAGQYRMRIGNYRIRYDVIGTDVILYSFKHRKAAY